MRALPAALLALFAMMFLSIPAPAHAISALSVSPSSIATGDSVTITLTQIVGPLPDVFIIIHVNDPAGDEFTYTNHHVVVSSSVLIDFPNPLSWTCTSGPCTNTGTDVSGTYAVSGTYEDTSLVVLGHFVVLSTHDSFNVPEFGQSILLLVDVMIPALLVVRRMSPKQPF